MGAKGPCVEISTDEFFCGSNNAKVQADQGKPPQFFFNTISSRPFIEFFRETWHRPSLDQGGGYQYRCLFILILGRFIGVPGSSRAAQDLK